MTMLRKRLRNAWRALWTHPGLIDPGLRQYGPLGTVHRTTHLDVETCAGRVVAVWFRCQQLPFVQAKVSPQRAFSVDQRLPLKLHGVLLEDLPSENGRSGGD